jgi:hypothetical protein
LQVLIYLVLVACLLVGDTYLSYMIFNGSSSTCEGFTNPIITNIPTTTSLNLEQLINAAQDAAKAAQEAAKLAADAAAQLAAKASDAASVAKIQAAAADATRAAQQAQDAYQAALNAKTPAEAQVAAKAAADAAEFATAAYNKSLGINPPVMNNYSLCYELTNTQLGFARFKMAVFWILYVIITCVLIYGILKLFKYDYHVIFAIITTFTVILSVFILVGGAFMTKFVFNGDNKSCKNPSKVQYCYNMNDIELVFAKIATVFGWLYSIIGSFVIGMFIWEANFG